MDGSRRGEREDARATLVEHSRASSPRLGVNRRRGSAPPSGGASWRARLPAPAQLVGQGRNVLRRALPALAVVGAVVGVGVVGFACVRYLTHSSRFAIAHIDVRGVTAAQKAEVLSALPISIGDNAFSIDVRKAERTLADVVWIAHANVYRELPAKLVVEVVARVPVAVVSLGEMYLADASGHPFRRAEPGPQNQLQLPVITGWDRADYVSDREGVASSVRAAVAAVNEWHATSPITTPRPLVSGVAVDPIRGFSLTTTTGLTVRLGSLTPEHASAELPARLRMFDTAWASLAEDERALAHAIHLDSSTRTSQVIVAFAKE